MESVSVEFLDAVEAAKTHVAENIRVSLRGLRRQFDLDDETLEDLIDELVDVQQVARREGNVLVWIGENAGAPAGGTPEAVVASGASSVSATTAAARPMAAPEAAAASLEASGERRQLTVMFCDLVGSTTLAEHIDPEELRNLMRGYRAVCEEATKRFGGHIAQYLGDGVMVFFCYPDAREDAAGSSIRAGLEIQRLLAERVADERIQARVGIHTGLVVVEEHGAAGSGVVGSTTIVASRIEGAAQPGKVVVSDATLSLCRGVFVTNPLGNTALKGLDEPVLLHEVERTGGVHTSVAAESTKPMLGRDREIGLLLDRWEEVEDGRGQVVLVSGEAGMGKSRLLHDEARAEGNPDPRGCQARGRARRRRHRRLQPRRAPDGQRALHTIEALPEIVSAVDGRIPVLIDSGFRRGADVFTALALGASAVCIGRPYLWGLAAFGQAGVEGVLRVLRREFETVMRHMGTPNVASITGAFIRPRRAIPESPGSEGSSL